MKNRIVYTLLVIFSGFVSLGCGTTKTPPATKTATVYSTEKTSVPNKTPFDISQKKVIDSTAKKVLITEVEIVTTKPSIHKTWSILLQKHVNKNGDVDYQGFKKDIDSLNSYLGTLEKNIPSETSSREQKLAYWINVYNAFTVKLILNNYPLKSIKDIKKPWSQRFFKLGEKWYNLNEVEHKILRKMNEPRIHFAIVCASVSCPKLQNKAFEEATLEEQLQDATRTFLNDATKNTITSQKLEISLIFKWFAKDFKQKGSIIDFIKPYTEEEIPENVKITYQKYNWQLNGS